MTAELVLLKAAEDGSLDPAEWPTTLQYILRRLDEIIVQFPTPTLSSQEPVTGDKENAAPAPPRTPTRPPVPSFSTSTPSVTTTATATAPDTSAIPQDTLAFYSSIRNTLSTNFTKDAPHTIQRLAELILEPKRRYRHLPPYLRALDRVVSVSSPNSLFPLPQAVLPSPAGGLLNGAAATPSPSSTLGSDESLGGALLTPIPWLQTRGAQSELISESTEMVDGPNGAGRIETVTVGMLNGAPTMAAGNGNSPTTVAANSSVPDTSVPAAQIASSHPEGETLPSTGAVTQGEILRQEQEAGVVLNNPHSLTHNPNRNINEVDTGPSIVETVEPVVANTEGEEVPHARGPDIIGMEDTGPQKPTGATLDIEGAVGRPSILRGSKSPGPAPASETKDEDNDMKDKDGDANDNAEKKTEEEPDEEMKSGE